MRDHFIASGGYKPANGQHPETTLNQISSKKFFESKIDFMAPVKSLQPKNFEQGALSDDSAINEMATPHKNLGGTGLVIKSKDGPALGQYQPNMSFIEEEQYQHNNSKSRVPSNASSMRTLQRQKVTVP